MSILTVNLKHLYQRRGLWLVYVFLGFIIFLCIAAALDHAVPKGQFMGFVLLSFMIGLLAGVLPLEVVTKPFSYCLPGHRKTVRQFIFLVGTAVNFLGSLLFLMYPGLRFWQLALVPCSALFAGLIFYWLGIGYAFAIRTSGAFVGFLPLVIVAGGFFDFHVIMERAIVENPAGVILAGVLASAVAWFLLGAEGLARRYCAVPWIGFFDVWNRDKMQKYHQAKAAIKWEKLKKHTSPSVERFFLGHMERCHHNSQGRYIWGGLYTAFGLAIPQWKQNLSNVFWALIAACLLVCFLSYMGPAGSPILFIMPGFMVAQMRLPVHASMLISGGRRERFITTITLVATTAVLATILVTILAAFSLPLAAIVPEFTLRGATFTFYAMNTRLFFIPLFMIPIVSAFQLLFFKRPSLIVLSIMPLFVLLYLAGILWRRALGWPISPVHIASVLVLSWLFFTAVLHYTCMRRCLV